MAETTGDETTEASPKPSPVTITIEDDPSIEAESFQVSGQIVNSNGLPIAGAHIVSHRRVTSRHGFGDSLEIVRNANSDGAGRYSLPGLPPDCPRFFIQGLGVTQTVVMVPPKRQYEVNLVLPRTLKSKVPTVTLRGQLVDFSGEPIFGVRASAHGRRALTDAEGRFALQDIPQRGDGTSITLDLWKEDWTARTVSVPWDQAARELCRIELPRLDVAGVAVFLDGSPIAEMSLEFRLSGTHDWGRKATTDREGGFSFDLPEPCELAGHVDAIEPGETNYAHDRWRTRVDGLQPGQTDLRLVFDNRNRIRVLVQTANRLPDSVHLDVACEMLDVRGPGLVIARNRLSSKGGETVFENLSPGPYRITVQLRETNQWNWKQEVVIEERPEDPSIDVTFKLPTMEFGGVKALVLPPDGETPVPQGRVSIGSSKSYDSVAFVDGKVELKNVPVGRVYISAKLEGMQRQFISGHVEPDQMTDLGAIVLQRTEDVTGWVEGRVLYDDGTPALGTRLGSSDFARNAVGAKGDFRFPLPQGETAVGFNLSHAARWPATAAFDEQRTNPDHRPWYDMERLPYDTIAAPVEVTAGETVTRDIVLQREPLRNLTVHWAGDPDVELFIATLVDMEDYRLMRRLAHPTVKGRRFEIPHLGSGAISVSLCAVYFDDDREAAGFFGYQEIDAGVEDVEVNFDPKDAGMIEVTTVLADGTPVPDIGAGARPASFVPSLNRREYNMSRPLMDPKNGTWDEPGIVVRGIFQPGRYLLATRGNWEEAKTVEVTAGETTKVTLVVQDP